MRVTTDHPASSYGRPVILDDRGAVMGDGDGVRALRRSLGLSVEEFGARVGASGRTVEGWERGRWAPMTRYLYAMMDLAPNAAPTEP